MFIRVFEIPPYTGNFHFGKGESQIFIEVDWFDDTNGMMETPEGQKKLINFVRGKIYYNPDKSYLLLHQDHSLTINYGPL